MARWSFCLLYTSGDIAAAVGFKITATGDTICDEKSPVILESMEFPEPVIDVAIEPKTKAGPVSYTHLDVYKRQGYPAAAGR